MGYENNAAKLEAQGRIIYLKDVSQVFKGSRKYIINTISPNGIDGSVTLYEKRAKTKVGPAR